MGLDDSLLECWREIGFSLLQAAARKLDQAALQLKRLRDATPREYHPACKRPRLISMETMPFHPLTARLPLQPHIVLRGRTSLSSVYSFPSLGKTIIPS